MKSGVWKSFLENQLGKVFLPLHRMDGDHPRNRPLNEAWVRKLGTRFEETGGNRLSEVLYVVPKQQLPSTFKERLLLGDIVPTQELPNGIDYWIIDGRHRHAAATRWLAIQRTMLQEPDFGVDEPFGPGGIDVSCWVSIICDYG